MYALMAVLGSSGCRAHFDARTDASAEPERDACATPGCADLLAYWKLDDELTDVIAGRPLRLFGGVTWTTGRTGMALEFDGKDARAAASPDPTLDNLSSLTFTAWIKLRGDGLGGLGPILVKGGSGSQAAKRWLINSFVCATTHCLELTVNRATEDGGAASNTGVTPSSWQFAAATFDPVDGAHHYLTSAEEPVVLQELTYNDEAAGTGMIADDTATPYVIGGWPDKGDSGVFDGAIDEVQIYRRVLTRDELRTIAAAP
jgi:hypothetical protein